MNQVQNGIARLLHAGMAFAADGAGGAAAATPQNSITSFLVMVVPFALIFYFLMYRPQKKKQQQHEKMIASIGRGDTVITAGGFFGKVSEVLEDSYIIELGDGVKARILKGSVSSKREGGEDKSRPRKLKKRKRERPKTATEEIASQAPAPSPEPAPTSPSSKALEEGVSIEEHAALFEGIVERQTDEPDALQKPKDD